MSVEIKRIVEESKSPKELLDKLDKIDHRLSNEELEMVTGGENTGKDGCTGGVARPGMFWLLLLHLAKKIIALWSIGFFQQWRRMLIIYFSAVDG